MSISIPLRPISFLSPAVAAVCVLGLSASAQAEDRKPGQRFQVDSSMADIVEPTGHTSNIIFLNRCVGGCTIYPGYDDSRTNTSSVVAGTHGQTAYISEFAYGQAEWDDIVECVTRVYEPFGVVITDQDPGNVSHFEAIVAGTDDEISTSAGGIAPASCGVINNAITFSFANQGSLSQMCWTVAQETAHAFGLDHELPRPPPSRSSSTTPWSTSPVAAPPTQTVHQICVPWMPKAREAAASFATWMLTAVQVAAAASRLATRTCAGRKAAEAPRACAAPPGHRPC